MLENNPVLDAIRSRRSIRKYTGEPIAEPIRRAILEAGFYAPSAMNRRPFHFVSITDRELMQKLSDLHPYAKMLPQADWAIIVCGDESVSGPFYMDDCAAATQNILLAAHSRGSAPYGAVWITPSVSSPSGNCSACRNTSRPIRSSFWACPPRKRKPSTG